MPGKRQSNASARRGPSVIHCLSDSTGNLARHMLTAFLTQFPPGSIELVTHNFLRPLDKLDAALDAVAGRPGVVFHAMVARAAKDRVAAFCAERGLPVCDLTGDFVDFIARSTGIEPSGNVAALHELSEGYRARIAALEFTLAHDDGLGLDTLHEAEIVLAGVSRTSKTPTSIFLGQQGYKVANIALAIESPVPAELTALGPAQVVGLLIDPQRLIEVRTSRRKSWSMQPGAYTDEDHVVEELTWSRRLFSRQGWRTLDVSNTAIEETAGRVIELLGLQRRA
jgi:[pyruvate, water dikinase]-phosphate phosphotransferase / [pyruvate, water dikinase] kinase